MRDSLDMGKHRVKNDPSPPKNDPSPPHRSDPSNEEYITVPKKVTFDSLVEFFPPQTQISPGWANFDLWGVAEKRRKKKKEKKEKERKKKVFTLKIRFQNYTFF
jgi:folate-dependent tRNA-U54 methylase TrmFO/GidA